MLIQLINLLSSQFPEDSIGQPILKVEYDRRIFNINVPHPICGEMTFSIHDNGYCYMSWILDDRNFTMYEGTPNILQVAVNIGHLQGRLEERAK